MRDHVGFFKKVNITDGCWEWKAGKNAGGYGAFCIRRVQHYAHRVSLMFQGIRIPEGMMVDHICRNRVCVNPEHLRIVTQMENVFENSDSAPVHNRKKTHCTHGHEFTEENTYVSHWKHYTWRRCRKCGIAATMRYYRKNKPQLKTQ